jgi:hypothetical protein
MILSTSAFDGAGVGDLLHAAVLDDFRRVAALVPDDLEQVLCDLAGNVAALDQVDDAAELRRGNRRLVDAETGLVQRAEQIVDYPVRRRLGVAPFGDLFEIVSDCLLRHQNGGIIGRQAERHKPLFLVVRQFRQIGLQRLDEGVVEFQRQKVGIREVAVVVRLFLGAHRTGLALARIEQAGFLVDLAAILENGDLAAGFVLDGLADEADRVDVLDFAARAEIAARLAHRDVDVGAHRALVHVAVAGAEIAQDLAQLGEIGPGLVGGAQIRLGDDLHQRDARAVQIDIGHGRVLIVHRLAGVLLQMQALDADLDILELALVCPGRRK